MIFIILNKGVSMEKELNKKIDIEEVKSVLKDKIYKVFEF
jgi:hypothetical protein